MYVTPRHQGGGLTLSVVCCLSIFALCYCASAVRQYRLSMSRVSSTGRLLKEATFHMTRTKNETRAVYALVSAVRAHAIVHAVRRLHALRGLGHIGEIVATVYDLSAHDRELALSAMKIDSPPPPHPRAGQPSDEELVGQNVSAYNGIDSRQ